MDKKIVMLPSVLIALLVAWVVAFYLPVSKQTKEMNQRLIQLEEKEREAIPEREVVLMERLVDRLSSKLDSCTQRIYPEEKLLDLGRVVEKIGKTYGLKPVSIAPDYGSLSRLAQSQEEISELPMMIEFGGSFSGFSRFIDGISDLPYAMYVREVVIQKDEEQRSSLSFQLKGVIVLRKAEVLPNDVTMKEKLDRA